MTLTLAPLSLEEKTPADYYQYKFDASSIPPKKIVGLLACQRDPLLRRLRTTIVGAKPSEIAAPPIQKGKGIKKKAKAGEGSASASASGTATPTAIPPINGDAEAISAESKGRLWDVEVLDTVIFPEGGGQPFDTGFLHIGGTRLAVEGCLRRKLDSVHLVRVPPESEALLSEAIGQEVELEVDWERRIDHMSIHTSQHLLSAILDNYAEGLPTLSWALTAYPSLEPPYVELPRGLTWKEVEEVEEKCNAAIASARRVWVDVAIQGNEDGEGRENRGIPKDYDGGVIRHVNIDGIDRNACCGTQLPNIAMCQFLHIIPPSLPSTSTTPSTSPTKLFFTSGPRAVKYLRNASRQVSLVAQALGTGRGSVADKAAFAEDHRRELIGCQTELKKELSKLVADQIAVSTKLCVWIHRTTVATHDFEWLSVTSLTAAALCQAANRPAPVIVLTSAPVDVKPAMLLVYATEDKVAKDVFGQLKVALEGVGEKGRVKGGGARGKYMAKVEGKWGKKEAEAVEGVVHLVGPSSLTLGALQGGKDPKYSG